MKEGALHELSGGWVWTKPEDAMDREFIKPQINADERRFVDLDIQHLSEVYQGNSLLKSPQSLHPHTNRRRNHDEERGLRGFSRIGAHPRNPRSIVIHLRLTVFIRG
jgi:hypothetical protein